MEILPLSEFANNKELDHAWIPLSLEFMQSFRNEEVVFISSDSTLSIDAIIFEFNATQVYKEGSVEENWNKILSPFANLDLGTQFSTTSFISLDCKEYAEKAGGILHGIGLINSNILYSFGNFIFEEPVTNEETFTSTEPDFPMAA
ncbi:MAG TPA: hypothetical protein VKR32_19625 [Puia sp.]|nr:hypothetical protein [Puia sp.]